MRPLSMAAQWQIDLIPAVTQALAEDVGSGDITAALIPEDRMASATVISREPAVLCGQPWFDEVFHQIDEAVEIHWAAEEGQKVAANQTLCTLKGNARSLFTGERAALNFVQLLSGTASTTRHYVDLIADTETVLLDTRKTIPGLRTAQKYAVTVGGGSNHRMGLYDAFLIKENHIAACGGIDAAVRTARAMAPGKPVEVETENLDELRQAIDAGADTIMLDNFSLQDMRTAVQWVRGKNGQRPKLEASGNVDESTIADIAGTGVDFISMGLLTKHCSAIDLSMRINEDGGGS